MQTATCVINLFLGLANAGSPVTILRIQKSILADPYCDAGALAVFMALASFANAAGLCWPSQSTIARQLGKSRSWVCEKIKILLKRGYITLQHQYLEKGGQTSNIYQLIPSSPVSTPSPRQPADTAPHQPADTPCQPIDTNLPNSNLPEPVDACACEAAPVTPPVGKPKQEEEPKPDDKDVPIPVNAVARRIQQCSRRPWKHKTALQLVLTYVAKVGLKAIELLASALEAEPRRLDPWEISNRMKALVDPQPSSASADVASVDADDDRRDPPAQIAQATPLPPGLTEDAVQWLRRRRVKPQHLCYLTDAERVIIEDDTATIIVASDFLADRLRTTLDYLLNDALNVRFVRVIPKAEMAGSS